MANEELQKMSAELADMISMARPVGVDTDLGTEHIGRGDMLIPRLALIQKTSKEIEPGDRFIEGAKFTDLFNTITKKVYGAGPLYFSILKADLPRGVQFRPLSEGGGVIDPNVPLDDPRMMFGEPDATGRATKPVATKFYDFIILLLTDLDMQDPLQNVMALSFKSTGIKVAKYLNTLIAQRGKKSLYKGVYEVRSGSETNAQGTFAVYKVKNAGWLKPESPAEALAAELYESWKDRQANIDLSTEGLDPDAPDAEKLTDKDIPY
jgi:hypothetical protein